MGQPARNKIKESPLGFQTTIRRAEESGEGKNAYGDVKNTPSTSAQGHKKLLIRVTTPTVKKDGTH